MAEVRDVSSLPLSRSVVESLLKNGFRFVSDLHSMQPLELAQEIGTTPDVALSIIQCAENSMLNNAQIEKLQFSAKDLLTKCELSRPIISFCKSLDVMMGGGVQIGQITEFCGVPGVGKTQLGIQLAINVQIPELFNGIGGEAIYIDTEGSFMVERVAEMAHEVSQHLLKLAKSSSARKNENHLTHLSAAESMTMERFLEGIHVFRCHDQTETIATINHLPAFLKSKTKIKVVVVDSIAFHFRQDLSDTASRSRVLSSLAQVMNQVAFDHNLAVVLVNHVTTRFERNNNTGDSSGGGSGTSFGAGYALNRSLSSAPGGGGDSATRLVPALGEQWSHCVTNRVMLYWDCGYGGEQQQHQREDGGPYQAGYQRQAQLVKSPTMPMSTANYCVCQKGIRDVSVAVQAEIAERKRKLKELQEGGTQKEK